MPIKCIIIDDEPLAIQILERHIAQIPDLELVTTFQNPVPAFDLLKQTAVDLIFLDIQMPLLTGIDFMKALQNPPKVIFTTAYRNYAIESYELDVVDYLLKPISFTRFFKAVNKVKNLTQHVVPSEIPVQQEVTHDHLYVNSNKKFIKVNFEDILYIESIKDYVRIHTETQKIMTKDTISSFYEKLPPIFLRIHRSFIVNAAKVTAFTAADVEIGEREIPIGNSYKNEVMEFLKR